MGASWIWGAKSTCILHNDNRTKSCPLSPYLRNLIGSQKVYLHRRVYNNGDVVVTNASWDNYFFYQQHGVTLIQWHSQSPQPSMGTHNHNHNHMDKSFGVTLQTPIVLINML